MLVIWNGWGWLVPIIWGGAMIGVPLLAEYLTGDPSYYESNKWLRELTLLGGCGLIGYLGYYLNHKIRVVDRSEVTGEILSKSPAHSLYWIPFEYWGLIMLVVVLSMDFWVDSKYSEYDKTNYSSQPLYQYSNETEGIDEFYDKPMTMDELNRILNEPKQVDAR